MHDSEKKYRLIFENSPVSLWEEDFTEVLSILRDIGFQDAGDLEEYFYKHPDFIYYLAKKIKVRDINTKTLEMFNAGSKQELLGSLDKVIPKRGMLTLQREIIAIYDGKNYFEEETYNYTLDGNILYIFLSVKIPKDTSEFDCILVSMMDITERKLTEESLRKSEQKYRSIFENTGTAMIIIENNMTISSANKEFEALSDYTKQEIEGTKRWTDFVAFDADLEMMKKYHYQRRINPKSVPQRYEFRFQDKSGEIKYVSATIDLIPETTQSVASLLNITELAKAQEDLHESKQKYRLLAENTADIIWSIDPELHFTYISPSVERILGYSQEEAYNLRLDQRVTPSTYAMLMEKYHEIKAGRIKDTLTLELEQVCKDGSIIWTEVNITPVFDSQGGLFQIQGVTRDISERKAMENRQQLLRYAVESSLNGFALADLNGYITYISPSFLGILKFNHESEVLGKHFSAFLRDPKRAPHILRALNNQEQWNEELAVVRKDNKAIYIQLLASVVRDVDDNPLSLMASFIDITDRKKAEEELQQAYKHLEQRVEARTRELKNNEARLRRSQQVAKVATWEWDVQTREIFWSEEHFRLFGYEPHELSEREILKKHVHLDDLASLRHDFYDAVKQKRTCEIRFFYTTKSGKQRVGLSQGKLEMDETGEPLYIYGTMQDITDKIETEQALQKSKEDYESLLLSTQRITSYKNIIGKSKQMREIYALIQHLAKVDTTVLITGESGTGKELVAEALHYSSARAKGPMIKANTSALSENLLESELFGHVRGAFTGAVSNKSGLIESAEKGTLFLDEIGEISHNLQLKLLRFLQEKKFERVGDVKQTLRADVRIVAATNADLSEKVKQGSFRADLYYRLKVVPVHIPPLRERTEDIPLLINYFCSRFSQEFNKKISGVSQEVLRYLMSYPWPGNVRELEHVLERTCLFCSGGQIQFEHLPDDQKQKGENHKTDIQSLQSHSMKKEEISAEAITEALRQSNGNRSRAADLLGISRRTFYRKLHAFGLLKELS